MIKGDMYFHEKAKLCQVLVVGEIGWRASSSGAAILLRVPFRAGMSLHVGSFSVHLAVQMIRSYHE